MPKEGRTRQAWPVCAALVLGLMVWPAWAATVYRCGPGGKVFSQTPCLHEDGQRLEVEGEVSGARQAEALEVSRREAATARSMSRADAATSKASAPRGAKATVIPLREVSVGGKPGAPSPARLTKPEKPRDFTARVPKPPKDRKAAASSS